MKKYWKIVFWLLLILITVAYTYYVRPLVDDELFNYGFAKNILDGLIPYKDFNMIIPPLFSYFLALLLVIFSQKLIIYHVVIALFIVAITYLSYRKVGKLAISIYFILLIYPYTGYNMFCLFLLFLLLNLKEGKYAYLQEAFLISCMFLSKQTLGLLVIPSLIYSKQKKKTFLVYLLAICLFLLYLITTNSLIQFIDYGLLGMFDFANKNSTEIDCFFVVECFIILGLIYMVKKTKRKDIFFCLMFQVITLPIVNYCHFMISFIPVMYLIFLKFSKNIPFLILTTTAIISFFLSFNFTIIVPDRAYLGHYQINNFMKGRMVPSVTSNYVFQIKGQLDNYEGYHPYVLGLFSYLVKLNNDMPITKYDLINNGNMGYQGSKRYIQEIDDDCKQNKCVFIISDEELRQQMNQTNMEILEYVQQNYRKQYGSNIFSVYIN